MALRGRVDDLEESSHETGAVDDDKRIVEWGQGIIRSSCASLRPKGIWKFAHILPERFIYQLEAAR